ncbi:MAG: BrxA/BrxB family bacilliredoxin [Bacteroidota bacterium]
MYPETLVIPMEAELTEAGFIALKTAKEVADHFKSHTGSTMLVINSLCGCAGPDARLGVTQALEAIKHKPDHLVTIFAGVDEEAMMQAQEYIKPYPLSAPAIALIKDGGVVHFLERHQIKGKPADTLASELATALEQYC